MPHLSLDMIDQNTTLDQAQAKVFEAYRKSFGRTPLVERLRILTDEALELKTAVDLKSQKDEAGDLLSCLLALCSEMEWDASSILKANLDKINRRYDSGQYASLGRKTQVCLIGGAFDPPHEGHKALGKFILSLRLVDEVWYVPCNSHMYGKNMTGSEHRLNMVKLMVQDDGRMKAFDYEIKHKLAGETYHFLNRLLNDDNYSENYSFHYAIGMDNANSFDQWVNYELLEKLIPFIVISRPGVSEKPNVDWYRKNRHKFFVTETELPQVSSSDIRAALRSLDQQAEYFLAERLHKDVSDYIFKNNLYK